MGMRFLNAWGNISEEGWFAASGLWVALVLALGSLGGCNIIGFFANVAATEQVPARYTLPVRPTLVLVDDPTNALGDPGLSGLIASKVGQDLTARRLVSSVVDPRRTTELAAQMGPDWLRVPADQVGRQLGAAQVIHVHIVSASLAREPGVFVPSALVYVKVIDTSTGKRLFPSADSTEWPEPSTPPELAVGARGYPLRVLMSYRVAGERDPQAVILELRRSLAERIGRDVARLFYQHPLPRTSLSEEQS